MKTAIYIEDGTVQLIITPEHAFEKNVLSTFEGKELEAEIFSGAFYDSREGWIRQKEYKTSFTGQELTEKSLILRIKTESKE